MDSKEINKNHVINSISKNPFFLNYCKKLCRYRDISYDLYQQFMLILCEKPEQELIELYSKNYLEPTCTTIIFRLDYHRKVGNTSSNPLGEIHNNIDYSGLLIENESYNDKIDSDFDNVMNFLNKDKTIKDEDVAVLFESIDDKLLNISKRSGVPYITLKIKRKKLREKIKKHVKI